MDFEKLSAERYSLRKFDTRPVEQEKLDLILEAGRNAPTAHNNQPQRIFVFRSPEALEKAEAEEETADADSNSTKNSVYIQNRHCFATTQFYEQCKVHHKWYHIDRI